MREKNVKENNIFICELSLSISLPRNKINMKLDHVSIKGTNKLPYRQFKWDSTCANDIARSDMQGEYMCYNIHPARAQTCLFYSVKIITVTTIITMIYHLLKGDSTYANTNQPN